MNCMLILQFICLTLLTFSDCKESSPRKITFETNPNCPTETVLCDKPWIIDGKGENANNTIHYLWSAMKVPTFIIASSTSGLQIQIDWEKLEKGIPGSVIYNPLPDNVFGVSFQSLILFNDTDDSGKLDNITEANKRYFSLSNFEWTMDRFENVSSEEFLVKFRAISYNDTHLDNVTELSFVVTAFGYDGRSDSMPHLISTPTSVEVEVLLVNLTFPLDSQAEDFGSRHFSSPRWALDAVIVSNEKSEDESFVYENQKSLDDEHSPGIFDVISITTPGSRTGGDVLGSTGGYLQWRPVCYLTPDRNVMHSTYPNFNVSLPRIDSSHLEAADESLLHILFGEGLGSTLNAQTTIAFGLQKDGFYTKYNYSVWTFSMGLGSAPKETFSKFAIILIAMGLGIPLLLFLAGGIYLLAKRRSESGQLLLGAN